MFAVFRGFRRLLEALELIGLALSELVAAHRDAGQFLDRINALERSRHQFEAECEGKLLRADGKLKAASNAEARERQLKRSYERVTDQFDPDGAEPEDPERAALLEHDAQEREAERVQAMRLGLAPNNKTLAIRAKFGL